MNANAGEKVEVLADALAGSDFFKVVNFRSSFQQLL